MIRILSLLRKEKVDVRVAGLRRMLKGTLDLSFSFTLLA